MNKKIIKYLILVLILVIIALLIFFIYNNLFKVNEGVRYKGIENYELTKKEIKNMKEKLNELEEVESIDIYIDSKIIKIVLKLENDIDFETIKTKANECISSVSEDNRSYYDIQFFVSSNNKESEVYPQIGYKFKTNSEFSW